MAYLSLFLLAFLLFLLIRVIVNEIKQHITKESDRIIKAITDKKSV